MKAVVLAGGRGTRLLPYTSVLPKPLMPIGERAILEIVVEQLVKHGFQEIALCVGHLSHLIEAVLDDGGTFGAEITYVKESEPLGTARPFLSVPDLRSSSTPFLVMNGDVLTSLDYGALFAHHLRSRHAMTIATRQRINTIDYGILELAATDTAAPHVTGFLEKPQFILDVSMGIYVVEPRVLDLIPANEAFDIPQLIHALVEANESVGAYRFDGFWLDIGRPDDYHGAGALWAEAVGEGAAQPDSAMGESADLAPSAAGGGSLSLPGTIINPLAKTSASTPRRPD